MMSFAIVSGALANKCRNGGNAWARLQWVLGLRALGFDVVFVEQIAEAHCVDEHSASVRFEDSLNRAFFRRVCQRFGLEKRSALVCDNGAKTDGLSLTDLEAIARDSSLLVNIGGHLSLEKIKRLPACRIFLDDDPGYTQFWNVQGIGRERLAGHDAYFTLAANLGRESCSIPVDGVAWRPVGVPVFLDAWPAVGGGAAEHFTTIASWRGAYGPVQYDGKTYGQKVHEFRKFVELPQQVEARFEIALDIDPGDDRDRQMLEQNGWNIRDPREVSGDPDAYQQYIQRSGSEFSAAQSIYVETMSGWFSDRTACYLASGKPVLVQDTGLGSHYPMGEGLVTFRTPAEAAAGAEAIVEDYERHCRAARSLAETFFDARKVLTRLLDLAGAR